MNELLQDIPWGLVGPILVLQVVLMIAALVMLAKAEETNGPKWMWVLIILFASLLGSIAFFVAGRRNE